MMLSTAAAAASQDQGQALSGLPCVVKLSVVVFRRLGWTAAQYHEWSDRLLRDGFAFVTPTWHRGETFARFAVVSPLTTPEDTASILDTMRADP